MSFKFKNRYKPIHLIHRHSQLYILHIFTSFEYKMFDSNIIIKPTKQSLKRTKFYLKSSTIKNLVIVQ